MGNDTNKINTKTQEISNQDDPQINHEMFKRYRYLPKEDWLEITVDVP